MTGILVPTTAAASTKFGCLHCLLARRYTLLGYHGRRSRRYILNMPLLCLSRRCVAISKRRSGEAEIGNSVSATDYENYHGLVCSKVIFPDLRMLFTTK